MKAKYLGNPNSEDDGPRRVGFAGKSFPRGVFIDVGDVPEKLMAKLAVHPNFEVSDKALTDDDRAAADAVNGAAAGAGDNEGKAAAPQSKTAVIAALEAIQAKHPEVTFSPKWPAPKLQATLEAARFEHGDDED